MQPLDSFLVAVELGAALARALSLPGLISMTSQCPSETLTQSMRPLGIGILMRSAARLQLRMLLMPISMRARTLAFSRPARCRRLSDLSSLVLAPLHDSTPLARVGARRSCRSSSLEIRSIS